MVYKDHSGKNTLVFATKNLTKDIDQLKHKDITNKMGRNTTISQMVKAIIPIEFGMELNGHQSAKSYME